ncbi:MAG TPA: MbnH family di-heme enzyme, partial [Polyangiaceae bacterium]
PLNLSSLYWSWTLGRLFLSIMTSAETGATTRFESALHVGSTGCTGDPELGGVTACDRPNRAEFEFPEFRPGKDVAVADLEGALRQARLAGDLCHSFTEDSCRGPFEDLGIDWSTGLPLPGSQRFLRIEARPGSEEEPDPEAYVWSLPKGFPLPVVPEENPMSVAKVELGRHLFYDPRLSGNGTQACASCHEQERAFTDGRAVALGSTGEAHPRNSMSLANVAYATTLAWANPLLFSLESQALVPMFGSEPVELGLNGRETELLERLRAVPRYGELFGAAYPGVPDPFSVENVTAAIASFERTLISGSSPYDRYLYRGDADALSAAARRGRVLFFSEKLECFHCHSGFNLQDSANFAGNQFPEARFHNTALYNLDGAGAYPPPNTGIHELSGRTEDMGRFRVPTLRNVAVTAPYMHDGSIATLEEVLDHYAAGGRTIAGGPYAGNGSASPLKSPFMIGFTLTPDEREAVLAFLESLTDEAFLRDPRFSNPWPASE